RFAERFAGGTETAAGIDGAIFEGELRRQIRHLFSRFQRHKTTQNHVLSKRVVLTYLTRCHGLVRATPCGAAPQVWRAGKTERSWTSVHEFRIMRSSSPQGHERRRL